MRCCRRRRRNLCCRRPVSIRQLVEVRPVPIVSGSFLSAYPLNNIFLVNTSGRQRIILEDEIIL